MAPRYRERYNQLRTTELQRNQLLEELLDENERLKSDLQKTTHRLERDSDTVELYQQRSKEAIAKYETMQKLTDLNAYICVLIDGDSVNFRDQLVRNSTVGGQDAAKLLRTAVADHARGLGLPQDVEIMLYVYADVYGLLKVYRDSQLILDPGDFDRFINGFNKSYPLLNFIDSGNGKECTENKLREMLKLHVHNVHCKHLVFGGCFRNGCSGFLEQLVSEESARNRMTLLHGPPITTELSRISNLFRVKSFPKVFRDTMIEVPNYGRDTENRNTTANPDAGSHLKTIADESSPAERFLESLNSYPSLDHSETIGSGRRSSLRDNNGGYDRIESSRRASSDARFGRRSSRQSELGIKVYPPEHFTDAPLNFIARNKFGQRVDVPLTQPPAGMINEIKKRKLCNDYCLGGRCQTFNCKHEHATDLSKKELHVLRDVARSFPCQAGLRCNNKDCFHGHRCPVDPCGFIRDRICRYPPDLHNIDPGIVNKDDLDEPNRNSHDESHILGTANRSNEATFDPRSPPLDTKRSRRGEPLYRNVTKIFDNTPNSGTRRSSTELKGPLTGTMQPPPAPIASNDTASNPSNSASPTALSDSYMPGSSIKLEERASSVAVPISPLKRTADEAGCESKLDSSPPTDPRLAAQKRVREKSA